MRPLHLGYLAVFLLAGKAVAASPGSLDGLHVTLGPAVAVVRSGDSFSTATGAEISLINVAERRLPGALGIAVGGLGFTDRAGGRLWLEGEFAITNPLPVAIGLGLGTTVEVDRVRPPRFGLQSTLWFFLGVIPYLRVGAVAETGIFWEVGAMVKLPIADLRY